MWFLTVIEALTHNKVKFAVAGGYAVALHGAVRGTVDLDIVVIINPKNLETLESTLQSLGLVSRIPVTAKEMSAFHKEYVKSKNLIAWSFTNPKNPAHVIDIIIAYDLSEFTIEKISIHGKLIPILSKKSLIKMKKQSARPQDMEDIKALEELDD